MSSKPLPRQPEVNLGTLGHVDNGKSTLVQALTGIWPARHSEELRRGITIRVGYADTSLYKCPRCDGPSCYCTSENCPNCSSPAQFLRAVSFVDCPGHHSLMVTMLSGAALMDGALLVLAANERCPQPQDREHLAAAEVAGIDKIVIVQNKIDIVDRERAVENYKEITDFVKGTVAEEAPIIPMSAQHSTNIDVLIEAIEKEIPTPERDLTKPPIMHVVRSFDVNRPGTPAEEIVGGVIGGSISQGVFRVKDEVEISPGIRVERGGRTRYEPLHTRIVSLQAGGGNVKEARCGGLVGVGTLLDPSLTKADGLVGNLVAKPGTLPPALNQLTLDIQLFDRAIGTEDLIKVERIRTKEALVLNVGTAVTSGIVTSARRDIAEISLTRLVCAEPGNRVAISRRIGDSWRLIGYGIVRG
ncbi:MAG: translation initiation factor IF-2 subunit gamma [Candidatus Bathyarchaeia archaeon]